MTEAMEKSVIIVGGGIAGLAAANELARRRVPVTVLEAADRFGGRILTIKRGSQPIELGAEFIHGRDPALLKAIEAAGLSQSEVATENHIVEAGRLKAIDFWERMGEITARVDLRKPDCSWTEFLSGQDVQERDRLLALAFAEGFNAADAKRISAHAMLTAQNSADKMDGDWQGRVDEGYGELIRFLVQESQRHGARLMRNARVQRIRWKGGQVEVSWQAGTRVQTSEAKAVIVAIPLGIWKTRPILFEPQLSRKQAAVHELASGDVMKAVMVFKSRWWDVEGFVHAPTERVPTWWGSSSGAVLTGWVGGPQASELLSCSPKHVVKVSLKTLGNIFSEKASRIGKQLAEVHCHHWARDPNIREGYSYIPVHCLELPNVMAMPIADTLFFAGEFTTDDAQTGTVFGAYKTGLRAAREVCTAFSEQGIRSHKRNLGTRPTVRKIPHKSSSRS